ncbi:MAG TPA: hypothetical protein DCE42_05035 [Myxococcales bacterium]|nr:hypothetical protein [Myxococcales bacterium]
MSVEFQRFLKLLLLVCVVGFLYQLHRLKMILLHRLLSKTKKRLKRRDIRNFKGTSSDIAIIVHRVQTQKIQCPLCKTQFFTACTLA